MKLRIDALDAQKENIMNQEKFFVVSNSDEPERIFFDRESTFSFMSTYVDSFDDKGIIVQSYKLTDQGDSDIVSTNESDYTINF